MSKYKVEITGINTNDIKVLSNAEMVELFKKYQEGDLFARDLLVQGNLKLVLSISTLTFSSFSILSSTISNKSLLKTLN